MITLVAKNKIITSTGSHLAGAVFKATPDEATFLLKKGAAAEVKKKNEPVKPDSPEKIAAAKTAKAAQKKAEAVKKAANKRKKRGK